MRRIQLTPPVITPETIKDHLACIRPKRIGGPRIEVEHRNNKLIVHNYGHGGFGWSMLPGSVLHSIKIFKEAIKNEDNTHLHKTITVIGAGCMGLLTAIMLHQQGWTVKIVTEKTEMLTSHKAAGSAAVIAIKASRELQPLMDTILVKSYQFFKEAKQQNNYLFKGVKQVPVYMFHDGSPNYRYPMINAGTMNAPEDVIVDFGTTAYQAKAFETFLIETEEVMHTLLTEVKKLNISINQHKVSAFEELKDSIVFNCSGLGARAWDKELTIPVKGHLVRLQHQPLDKLHYILYAHVKINGKRREISWTPNGGGRIGGYAFNFQDSLEIDPLLGEHIIERAQTFFYGAKKQ